MQNCTMPYRSCCLQNSLSLIFVLLFMVSEVSSAETAQRSYWVPDPRPSNGYSIIIEFPPNAFGAGKTVPCHPEQNPSHQ